MMDEGDKDELAFLAEGEEICQTCHTRTSSRICQNEGCGAPLCERCWGKSSYGQALDWTIRRFADLADELGLETEWYDDLIELVWCPACARAA